MFTVHVSDEKAGGYDKSRLYFQQISLWAIKYCTSYSGYDVVDVSDTSTLWDEVAEYRFEDEQDATMFTLKWK